MAAQAEQDVRLMRLAIAADDPLLAPDLIGSGATEAEAVAVLAGAPWPERTTFSAAEEAGIRRVTALFNLEWRAPTVEWFADAQREEVAAEARGAGHDINGGALIATPAVVALFELTPSPSRCR